MSSKITQLSATFPPILTTTKYNIDPFISSRKNVLAVDLVENQKRSTPIQTSDELSAYPKRVLREDLMSSVRAELEKFKSSQEPIGIYGRPFRGSPENRERNTLLIHRIRKIVSEDAARQPEDRIDCIEIGPEPWPEHLRALDGLSPKHLRVDGGFIEEVNVIELDKLNTKFKLDSLCISGVIKDWSVPIPTSTTNSSIDPAPSKPQNNHRFPEFFTHVRSLTLDYCSSITFKGTNLPSHLQQLKIIGNNAMDMFISAVDNMPNVSEQLAKVLIYTDPRLDMTNAFRLDDFRERLGRCNGLKEFTLVVADDFEARAGRPGSESAPFEVGLSSSLPNSIERLEFHCTNSEPMLADLDVWIEAAKNPGWLPRLKYIHIRTYDPEVDEFRLGKKSTKAVDAGRNRKLSEKIQRVYEVLKSRSPSVEVGL